MKNMFLALWSDLILYLFDSEDKCVQFFRGRSGEMKAQRFIDLSSVGRLRRLSRRDGEGVMTRVTLQLVIDQIVWVIVPKLSEADSWYRDLARIIKRCDGEVHNEGVSEVSMYIRTEPGSTIGGATSSALSAGEQNAYNGHDLSSHMHVEEVEETGSWVVPPRHALPHSIPPV